MANLKKAIHQLKTETDCSILVTEELHQVLSVEGYKKKSLFQLINTFGQYSYNVQLHFRPVQASEWNIQTAGKLASHINSTFTIPLRLVPARETVADHVNFSTSEQTIMAGKQFFQLHHELLQKQTGDDFPQICEFVGRLSQNYPVAQWEWIVCPKAGTSISLFLQPAAPLDPIHFLRVEGECKVARVSKINVYPFTIEVVFHASTKIEYLPYNRKHRARFNPYGRK